MNTAPPVLILGIGNCLMTDDGVGVHAARLLRQDPPPDTEVLDAGTDFFATLPFLERARHVLVIDAMDAGGPPGTIYHCRGEALARPRAGASLHQWDLVSMMDLLSPEQRPESVVVLGVQPARLGFGTELSAEVAATLPALLEHARRVARELKCPSGSGSSSLPAAGTSRLKVGTHG